MRAIETHFNINATQEACEKKLLKIYF